MGLIHVWRWKGSAGVRGREVALHLNNKWGNILNNEKQDDMNVSFTPLHLKARTVSVSDVLRTYDYYWSFAFTSHRTRDVLLQLKLHFTDEVCGQEAGGDLPKRWSCGRPWKCGCLSAIDCHKAIFGAQGFSSTNVHNSRNWTLRYQVLMIHEWLIQVDRSKQPQYFWQPVRTNMLATSCNIFNTKNKQWCTVMACFLSLCSDKVIGKNCRPCFTQGLGLARGLCSLFGALHGTLLFETAVYSPWQFGWNSLLCLALLTWLCPAWRVSSDSHGVGAARRVVDTLVQFLCYEDSADQEAANADAVAKCYSGPEQGVWELVMGKQIDIGAASSTLELAQRAHVGSGMKGVELNSNNGGGMRALVRLAGVDSMIGVDLTKSVVETGRKRTAEEGLSDKIKFINKNSLENGLPDPCHAWCLVDWDLEVLACSGLPWPWWTLQYIVWDGLCVFSQDFEGVVAHGGALFQLRVTLFRDMF